MPAVRRPLIAGNWKMNGLRADGLARAGELSSLMPATGQFSFDMLICPPATLIEGVGDAIRGSNLLLGGQDCHFSVNGAHTGDVSAPMLADIGCSHVIVGHSERRADHAEDDAVVQAKAAAVIAAGLIAIVCVGETKDQRKQGETNAVVAGQLAGSVPDNANQENLVLAYEPVWAIGTGLTPTADDVQEVHAMMRAKLAERIGDAGAHETNLLYGGSVKPSNAEELMALADVDGALVGGASLNFNDFWAIAQACPKPA